MIFIQESSNMPLFIFEGSPTLEDSRVTYFMQQQE
jgi:hypothetical protein